MNSRLKYRTLNKKSVIMHGANYRVGNGQPYTRKKYIKGKPQIKIAKFYGGKKDGDYDYCVQLCSNQKMQIRHKPSAPMPRTRTLPSCGWSTCTRMKVN